MRLEPRFKPTDGIAKTHDEPVVVGVLNDDTKRVPGSLNEGITNLAKARYQVSCVHETSGSDNWRDAIVGKAGRRSHGGTEHRPTGNLRPVRLSYSRRRFDVLSSSLLP